jgi:hypothetical protein
MEGLVLNLEIVFSPFHSYKVPRRPFESARLDAELKVRTRYLPSIRSEQQNLIAVRY